jgi:hypothetical protein
LAMKFGGERKEERRGEENIRKRDKKALLI